MRKFKDLTGMVFKHLTVVKIAERGRTGNIHWQCLCQCGKVKAIAGSSLVSGDTSSCGCLTGKLILENRISASKHGCCTNQLKTKEYSIWQGMLNRCRNPRLACFKYYGGKGITVCDEWGEFHNFLNDMGLAPTPFHTIDRIDNNQGYCKANCKWSTMKEQIRNRSNNHEIEYKGVIFGTVVELGERYGIKPYILYQRLRKGWSVEDVIMRPIRKKGDLYVKETDSDSAGI